MTTPEFINQPSRHGRIISDSVSRVNCSDDKTAVAQSEFLANITHELRTPMNAILGMTELALREDLSDVVRDYLLTARDSADTMLSLINDILDYSRMDVEHFELEEVAFDVRRLLDEAMRGLSLRAHERGLELAASVDPDVPLRILGDPVRLKQLLGNLISNAIKFTESGEVIVDVTLLNDDAAGEDSTDWKTGDSAQLEFLVKDTGIGIDSEDQKRIFEPFVQVDSSMTRSYSGTGLGLSICSRLVKLMQGQFWVESALGRGSTFHFTAGFEVAPAQIDRLSPASFLPDQLAGTRVLIVDDNESTRHILKEMAETWGMRASIADSVESARQTLQSASVAGGGFHLLIIDGIMPKQDGIEFLRQLEAGGGQTGASILMMSGADRRLFQKRIAEVHIDAFLEKPVSQSGLLNAITEAFEEQAAVRMGDQSVEKTAHSLRVLVADDIPANQKVVEAILTRRGHQPIVAHNGREAIDAYERSDFDVILMDVQMPILDGLQATKAIRELEKNSGRRVPIVAMTAHAMRGDRDACLAAGMDSYLSKPLDADLLLKTIEHSNMPSPNYNELLSSIVTKSGFWRLQLKSPVPIQSPAKGESKMPDDAEVRDVWNPNVALRRMGGDINLLSNMIAFFLEDSFTLLHQLKQLIDAGDAAEAARIAHSLKGLCSNFEAVGATQAGANAEAACSAGYLDKAAPLVAPLTEQIRQLSQALTTWQRQNPQ